MKKLILLLLICLPIFVIAQKTPETKPTFKVDTGRVIPVTLRFSLKQLSDFIQYVNNPNEMENSKTISVYDANQVRLHTQFIAGYIITELKKVIEEDRKKFTADTTAKYHPQRK